MKKISCFLLLFLVFSQNLCLSQEKVPDFHTPKEWRGETITLPPGFAPDLKWHGVEHIRFAPGMFKPDSDSFFSYLLVFLLNKDEAKNVSKEGNVQAQVLTYYRGLAKAVMGGKGMPVDTEKFKLKLDKKEGSPVWNGALDWVEPFATQKAQKLNMEISIWQYQGAPVLYFVVSPQAKDQPIWKEMRKYRTAFEVSGHRFTADK